MILVAVTVLCAWLTVLCYNDWRHRRLPNVLTLGGMLVVLVARLGFGGFESFMSGVWGGAACGLFALLPFLLHGLGGGDLKLLAACGCVVGIGHVAEMLLFMSFAGLFVMIVMLVCGLADGARLLHYARCLFDWRYDRKAGKAALKPADYHRYAIPYSIPIAVGTLLAIILAAYVG